jgi:hypothetical protein
MTEIRELLRQVSSDQPSPSLSVDDLVRAGRRRQGAMASLVATGTTVVVVAAVVAAVGVGRSPDQAAGSASPSVTPALAITAALPTAATASTQPIVAGPFGARLPVATAHLLDGGRVLQTTLQTDRCNGGATLTAVESQQQVTLTLALGPVPTASLPMAAQPSGGPPVDNSCGPRPAAVTTTGTLVSIGAGDVRTTLLQPLGQRRLVDGATGRTIPYTSETEVRKPTWLPAGINAFGPIQPVGSQGWTQRFEPDELSGRQPLAPGVHTYELQLDQTDNAPRSLGGPATDTVAGVPARVSQLSTTATVTWWRSGRLFTMTARSLSVLCPPTPAAPQSSCHLQSSPPALATTVLLRVAASIPAS